jgi:carboxypeptidase Taq
MNPLQELQNRLTEIDDLQHAAALLHWDQATYMPEGGAVARGRQLSTLNRLAHEKFIDPRVGELLENLRSLEENSSPESWEASLIRVTRRQYERAARVPSEFEARLSDHLSQSYQNWTRARPDNNWKAVESDFQKTLDLSRELASFFPHSGHIADPLINFSDEGMTASSIKVLFTALRKELVPLVEQIAEKPAPRVDFLHRNYPESEQIAFAETLIRRFGYDFNRGRQDKTHHPFMTKFSLGDVRITTRTREDDLSEALFSTLHEAGHALYEQGIDQRFEASPLGNGTSSGVHESQSRLWENLVGRSRGFWKWAFPSLQNTFGSQLQGVSSEDFYRAVNRVERSLIRTDADEVTYNLHVMIRFDLELALLEGTLAVADLPQAWRERYQSDLGITSPDDCDGCLQDVHWFGGTVGGAFQGYTLGNILSAQFYNQALKAHPDIPSQIESGEFEALHTWLRDNIYQSGATWTAPELIQRVTGGALTIKPYVEYLKAKFGDLYQLS